MKVFIFLLTLLASSILPISAQDTLLKRDLEKSFKTHELLQLNSDALQQTITSGEKIRMSAYGRNFEFDLELYDLRAPNYRAVETNSNGSYEMERGDVKTYRGKLSGDPDSQVRFTIASKIFEGLIYTGNTKYFVAKARRFSKFARTDDVVVYREDDLRETVDLSDDISRRVDEKSRSLFQPGTEYFALVDLRQIQVATEADNRWVTQAGNSAVQANNEILSIMNLVDGIYVRDLNLTVVVTYQHAWSTADPFSSASMSALLDSYLNYWNTNYPLSQYPRDTGHLFTGKFVSQGLAYVGVICRNQEWAYGVTARSGGSNHLVAAHEIGHNLGADHVASSGTCTNSMMNPFISGAVTAFCSTSISTINSYVASNGSCLTVVGSTPPPTPTPTPFPSPTPTPFPSPTPTIAPSPTPTIAPSPTPTLAPPPASPTPTPPPTPAATPNPNVRTNLASPQFGSFVTSSSGFANGAIDGSRIWAVGGAWKDTDAFSYPDWIQLDFGASRTFDEIAIYGVRDDYMSPNEPDSSTVSTAYGLINFSVQYWNGFGWVDVPGGNVSGNNKVLRRLTFAPVTASRIRVVVNSAADGYSRVVELEAWGGGSPAPQPSPTPTVVPSPTPTIAPSPTPTVAPSPTPSASPTPGSRANVALASNGATASASSALSSPSLAIDGVKSWAVTGSWKDSTPLVYPDWLQVDFNGSKSIDEVNIYGVRDDYLNETLPTTSTVSTAYGLVNFNVQYWTGTSWANVPNGNVTGNNLVVRKVTFSPITTSSVRVLVNSAVDGFSRIVELEAWGGGSPQPSPTPTVTPSPTPTVAPSPSPTPSASPTPSSRRNVALASNGGEAYASSELASPSLAIDGKKSWAASGSWKDSTPSVYPDWLQVDFAGSQTIDEIKLFGVRDDYLNETEPTTTTASSAYALVNFTVQYWNGIAWANLPGGTVTGNSTVVRRFTFSPVTTSSIRVVINSATDGFSRVVELEAWTGSSGSSIPDPVPTPTVRSNYASSASGATATASSQLGAASSAIDGSRVWASGGSWKDESPSVYPDWLQVAFSEPKTIDEIDVIGVMDDFQSFENPTESTTAASYGLAAFEVQYWDGNGWITIPNGNIVGNNRVLNKFTFSPITTTSVRVVINGTQDGYSRVVEIEAWGGGSASVATN